MLISIQNTDHYKVYGVKQARLWTEYTSYHRMYDCQHSHVHVVALLWKLVPRLYHHKNTHTYTHKHAPSPPPPLPPLQ